MSLRTTDQRLAPRSKLLTESGTQSAVFVGEPRESKSGTHVRLELAARSSKRMASDGRDLVYNAIVDNSPDDTVGLCHLSERGLDTDTSPLQTSRHDRHFQLV